MTPRHIFEAAGAGQLERSHFLHGTHGVDTLEAAKKFGAPPSATTPPQRTKGSPEVRASGLFRGVDDGDTSRRSNNMRRSASVGNWYAGTCAPGYVCVAAVSLPLCIGWLGRTPMTAQLKEDRDDLSSLVSRRPPMPASVYDPSLPISTSVRTSLVLCSFHASDLTCALRTHARIHALAGVR